MDWISQDFLPLFNVRRRKRKFTRTERRKLIAGKKRTPHGGRGRKYGFKGGKKQKKVNLAALVTRMKSANKKI